MTGALPFAPGKGDATSPCTALPATPGSRAGRNLRLGPAPPPSDNSQHKSQTQPPPGFQSEASEYQALPPSRSSPPRLAAVRAHSSRPQGLGPRSEALDGGVRSGFCKPPPDHRRAETPAAHGRAPTLLRAHVAPPCPFGPAVPGAPAAPAPPASRSALLRAWLASRVRAAPAARPPPTAPSPAATTTGRSARPSPAGPLTSRMGI